MTTEPGKPARRSLGSSDSIGLCGSDPWVVAESVRLRCQDHTRARGDAPLKQAILLDSDERITRGREERLAEPAARWGPDGATRHRLPLRLAAEATCSGTSCRRAEFAVASYHGTECVATCHRCELPRHEEPSAAMRHRAEDAE